MINIKLHIKYPHWSWVLTALIVLSGINNVLAEGSKDLYPQGAQGGRAYLRASTSESPAFPFANLATHYVYAEAGERIALASSAQTGTNSRIRLYAPDNSQINLSFPSGNGNIPNRTGELAGPRLPDQNTGGNRYTPLYHEVTQSGIYKVEFLGASGNSTGDSRMNYIAANSNWIQSNNSNYLAAWDISVAKQTESIWNWKSGRVYTTVINMDNPSYGGSSGNDNNNFRPNSGFYGKFKVLTRDGYVYNVDNNGNQGISFTFMVNNRGFHEIGNLNKPSYKSIPASTAADVQNRYHNPNNPDSEASVTQKVFYNVPDASMPEYSIGAVPGEETWLRIEEKNLNVDVITIEGVEGSSNQLGNKGAYIKFYNESGGDYYIEIRPKSGGVFFPSRKITGSSAIGDNKILWDGKDGDGNFLPNGLADVEIELKLRGAEVHFPYIDMELNHYGIILELLSQDLNSVRSDKVFWDDSDIRTVNTNTFGSMTSPRNASHEVLPNGTVSNTNGHIWGVGSSRTAGPFGDDQGMDTWTFIEGDAITADFEVNLKVADLEIPSITPSKTYLTVGDEVTYYIKAQNNGPSDVENAPFSFIVPDGFDPKSIAFNGNNGGAENVGLTYDPSTRTYNSTLDLPDGCVIYYTITMDVNSAINPGEHDFTATIMRPNDVTDPDATNPDVGTPPTDPFYECTNNGLGGVCNNIKTIAVQYDILGFCYDFVEGEDFDWFYKTSSESTITKTITQPGTNAGFVFDIYELDNSFNMNINGTMLATQEIEFQEGGSLIQNIRFADGTIWEEGVIEDIWKLKGETDKPIVRVEISSSGEISIYGSKVSATDPNYALEPLELFSGKVFNTINWNMTSDNEIEITQNVVGETKMVGYGSGQNIVDCKTYTLEKQGIFNDENEDGIAQPGETITYTLTVKNAGDIDIYNLKVEDPMLGGEITVTPAGDDNNDGILNTYEEWVYTLEYIVTQEDIDNKGVYNLATVTGDNVLNEDLDPETSVDPTPLDPNDPMYDSNRPDHTFVPLKGRSLLITNPMIYQRVKNN